MKRAAKIFLLYFWGANFLGSLCAIVWQAMHARPVGPALLCLATTIVAAINMPKGFLDDIDPGDES